MVHIIGPKDPRRSDAINTTSISKTWSKGLSPFFLGPIKLYDQHVSKNVENGWQFSKLYAQHADTEGNPTSEYFEWAKKGWSDSKAHRYPMGKGIKPLCSYWNGEKLTYLEARRKIYIPLYSTAVRKTTAFAKLVDIALVEDVWLWDFDGWDHNSLNMTYDDVIMCPDRKMGHAFVLGMLLEGACGFPRLI